MYKKLGFSFVALFVCSGSVSAGDKSPDQVLNDSWASVCANPIPGSDLEEWCPGLVKAGPTAGSFNASMSSGIGNSTIYGERLSKKAIEERKEKLKKKKGGSAGDILAAERLGFFASGKLSEDERESTVLEAGYESDMQGFTVGADYFFSDNFVAGIAVDYTNTDLDYNQNAGIKGGSSDFETVSVISYGNYRLSKKLSFDGYLGWSGVDFDMDRPLLCLGTDNAVAGAQTTANKVLAGVNVNYSVYVEGFTVTPMMKADYSGTFIDSYKESGGQGYDLAYESQEVHSFKTNLGFEGAYSYSVPWGVLIPKIKAGYVHEFLNNRRAISVSFVEDASSTKLHFDTDKPDRDYFVIGGGISSVLTHSVQMYVDYERIEGHRYLNSYTVSGGVRVAF